LSEPFLKEEFCRVPGEPQKRTIHALRQVSALPRKVNSMMGNKQRAVQLRARPSEVGTMQNVTAGNVAKQALRQAEEKYRGIFETR
jgi:hypothetical protein